jgi:hypothetical protein
VLQLQPPLVQMPELAFIGCEKAHDLVGFESGLLMPRRERPSVGHLLGRQQPLLREIL